MVFKKNPHHDRLIKTYGKYGFILDNDYGFNGSNVIKFRITGVLSGLEVLDKNSEFSSGDPIVIKTLGDSLGEHKFNNWFFNLSTTYQSESVQLLDSSNNSIIEKIHII